MKKHFQILLVSIAFIIGCGGENSNTSIEESKSITVTKDIIAKDGGEISFTDGTTFIIPKNSLSSDTKISITKDINNSVYVFEPDGLVSNTPMTLKIPVTTELISNSTKVVNVYILSNESPTLDFGTEQLKAEKLVTTLSGNLDIGTTLDVNISHFSQIRKVIQDPLYLSFYLPSKYLKEGDIVTFLSFENYVNNTDGFDWFPGHTAMITNPDKANDMIEAMPPYVRMWNLSKSSYNEGHIYMGARRPIKHTLSDEDRKNVVDFSKKQLGKKWEFVNSNEWFSSDYTSFSCVGLVEASYESIDKGLLYDGFLSLPIPQTSIGDKIPLGNPPMPLDMYEVTEPVNTISEVVGNDIEIRINPVYQVFKPAGGTSTVYGYGAYNDYRYISNTSSDFKFTASNLPTGGTFDSSTGIFKWNNIPKSYAGKSHTITFNLNNSYSTTFGGKAYASISEPLTISIKSLDNISSSDISAKITFSNSTLTVIFNKDMSEQYFTTGDYVPTKSYWIDKRTFKIDFSSYVSGGTIILKAGGFTTIDGEATSSDISFIFP